MSFDTVSMRRLVEGVLGRRELDPATILLRLTVQERLRIGDNIANAMDRCWNHAWWPLTMLTQERAFRDAWAVGTTYAIDAEVYRMDADGNDAYYVSLQAGNVGHAPESSPTWWEAMTDFDHYIPWAQTGKTRIGTPKTVWSHDPRRYSYAIKLPITIDADGLHLRDISDNTVFVEFRQAGPSISFREYVAGISFSVGEPCYNTTNGLCYRALVAGAGNSLSDTTKWELQNIPAFLASAAILIAAGDEWRVAGNGKKADDHDKMGDKELSDIRKTHVSSTMTAQDDCMRA